MSRSTESVKKKVTGLYQLEQIKVELNKWKHELKLEIYFNFAEVVTGNNTDKRSAVNRKPTVLLCNQL